MIEQIIIKMEHSQTDWIPVSERLPERTKQVLVTVDTKGAFKPYASIDYLTKYGGWRYYEKEHITAWMPLPPAYKESE